MSLRRNGTKRERDSAFWTELQQKDPGEVGLAASFARTESALEWAIAEELPAMGKKLGCGRNRCGDSKSGKKIGTPKESPVPPAEFDRLRFFILDFGVLPLPRASERCR
jgi:hypothetical protein